MKLARLLSVVGLVIATPMAAAPAFAAKEDVALLQSYVGSWKGRGELKGADSESVVCRLTLSPGNNDKVNYQGRCTLAGTTLSVNGTLAYNDTARRYEAAMTSNVTFSGIAVGKRQGKGILFSFQDRNKDEEGNNLAVAAAINLQSDKIGVDFEVIFTDSGKKMSASVPFTK